ncbi:decaprenyl-phosphate phosphoribosyltransferase [Plantactinospora mayteni]|uniref:Decaprenyl-phosphate phosphoribosyltransferase n=1 Tax=Plantactinospora mayteni TaxID=566021 RepID=A0ABQ4ER48_9ACTN|nr:decaprenyl-phosphate phosphoribosyltransferase [Plantactinospora mayteni]GIG97138.1 decaprenyl-phosphate phosphoribosyltransferase [Plantactinospora mayteni]
MTATAPTPVDPEGAAGSPPAPKAVRAAGGGLVAACRPRQWIKNLLVLTAPAADGVLLQPVPLAQAGATFVIFCLASSAGYLLNDARDVAADRLHPDKSARPIASGRVPLRIAYLTAAVLAATALAAAFALGPMPLFGLVVLYLTLTTAYTLALRDLVVVDLAVVAGCHVVRAAAGGAATGVALSNWYLIVVSLGSLLLVTGRREAELRLTGLVGTRPTLAEYSVDYLANVRSVASSAMIVTYCLWALAPGTFPGLTPRAASIVPFLLVVLRLNLLIGRGAGEQPEHLLFQDRQLQLMLGALAVVLAASIYGP